MTIEHRCGAVRDYCTFQNYKIFFCSVCKKVLDAEAVKEFEITIVVKGDDKMNEYSKETLEDNI